MKRTVFAALVFSLGLFVYIAEASAPWPYYKAPVYISGIQGGLVHPVVQEELAKRGAHIASSAGEAEMTLLVRTEYRFQVWDAYFELIDVRGAMIAASIGRDNDFNVAVRVALDTLIKNLTK